LFGSTKAPINEKKPVFYFDDAWRTNFVDGEMRCRNNMEGNDWLRFKWYLNELIT
jgi:hypothetical protein